MKTRYWKADLNKGTADDAIQEAAKLLREGGTVAFPTETVYGLGANAGSTAAVASIFAAKGRPSDNPLIVHIADRAQLGQLVEPYPVAAQQLMDRFWPGPLTIVLPVKPGAVSPLVTAGLQTVGIRMPDHPLALRLIAEAGCPVAAPSANRSGRPSPTRAEHVREDLNGRIDGILDGGPAGIGLESTVVELISGGIRILRPGGVTRAQLQEVVENVLLDDSLLVEVAAADGETDASTQKAPDGMNGAEAARAAEMVVVAGQKDALQQQSQKTTETSVTEAKLVTATTSSASMIPRSPGMKYTHYAPKGDLCVVRGDSHQKIAEWIQAQIVQARARGEKTGILTYEEYASDFQADVVIPCGSIYDLAGAASQLYAALRMFDEQQVRFILAEACEEHGIGFAVMNRLRRAAGHHVVTV